MSRLAFPWLLYMGAGGKLDLRGFENLGGLSGENHSINFPSRRKISRMIFSFRKSGIEPSVACPG
jgi:hypothetical protein